MTPEDAHAIEQLIPNLRRYARALVRDPDLADDLVQDCLERAIARFHHFTPGTNLRGWLFTILLNIVRSHTRSIKWRNQPIPLDDLRGQLAQAGSQENRITMRDLQRAFDQLPSPFQEVLMLVAVEGLSYDEAASAIGTPVGTVRSRLSRARSQIRLHMEDADAATRVPSQGLPEVGAEPGLELLDRMLKPRSSPV